jgi:hypothetical protein
MLISMTNLLAIVITLQMLLLKKGKDTMHPLNEIFNDAVDQCAGGKGQERHGMGMTFLEQKWSRLAKDHGIGFLTGQAQKKLEEAMAFYNTHGKPDAEWWDREMLGAIVYLAMAVYYERNMK